MKRKRTAAERAANERYRSIINGLIDAYRKKHDLSLTAFAKRCGISPIVLRRIQYGDTLWIEDLFDIAQGLETKAWKLVKLCMDSDKKKSRSRRRS